MGRRKEEEYSDLALDAYSQLLVEPYLNRCVGLQEFEDEIDWWEEDASAAAAASGCHCFLGVVWGVEVVSASAGAGAGALRWVW